MGINYRNLRQKVFTLFTGVITCTTLDIKNCDVFEWKASMVSS